MRLKTKAINYECEKSGADFTANRDRMKRAGTGAIRARSPGELKKHATSDPPASLPSQYAHQPGSRILPVDRDKS